MTLMMRFLARVVLSAVVLMLLPPFLYMALAASPKAEGGLLAKSGHRGLDLTGFWNFYVTKDGTRYEEAPMHMQIGQEETTLTLNATCDAGFPPGMGTLDGRNFNISFDLGNGASIEGWGKARNDKLTGWFSSPEGDGILRAERTGPLDCAQACAPVSVPRFVKVDYVDLALVGEISKFRSGVGHDYSDFCETCRSMKHYYYFYDEFRTGNGVIEVRSPIEGMIVMVRNDGHGASPGLENKEVFVRSSLYPTIFYVLSHVDLRNPSIRVGKRVKAGDILGHARLYYPDLGELVRGTEIAVMVHTPYGRRFVSYIDTLADSLFATYVARVATSTSFVIGKEERDLDDLDCRGEEFVDEGNLENWVHLSRP